MNTGMSSQMITGNFGEVYFRTELRKEDGSVISKTLDLDSYINLLAGSNIRKTDGFVHLGQIPKFYHDAWRSQEDESSFFVILDVPSAKRFMRYHTVEKPYLIWWPRLLFIHEIHKGNRRSSFCYALKGDEPLSGSTDLFMYPFGNVDSNSHCCFGNIGVYVKKLADVNEITEKFFSGITNDDYLTGSNARIEGPSVKQYQFFEMLSVSDRFPDEILVKSQNSYADVVSWINKKMI